MKTLSSALRAHLASEVTTLCTCWKLTRTDGQVFAFTDHDQNVVVSAITYLANTGFTTTAIESNEKLSVDNMEVEGLIDSSTITEGDLIAGLFDYATVEIFTVNYSSVGMGPLLLKKGTLGETEVKRDQFVTEIRSLTQNLQQSIGEVYSVNCRAKFGDSRCGIQLEPDDWAAGTTYPSSSQVLAVDYDARRYFCTTSGVSDQVVWATTANSGFDLSIFRQVSTASVVQRGVAGNRALTKNRYWEVHVSAISSTTAADLLVGIHNSNVSTGTAPDSVASANYIRGTQFATAPVAGDEINVAFNASSGFLWIGKNGSWLDGNPENGTSAYATVAAASTWYPWIGKASSTTASRNSFIGYFASTEFTITSVPAGFSAISAEPVWNTTIGASTADGTCVWTTYEAYTKEGTVTSVSSLKEFTDTSRTEASAAFAGGNITWTSGNNNGRSMEVKTFASGGRIELFQRMGYTIQAGDTYKVVYGCNKTVAACNSFSSENGSHGNIYNYRGEPDIPNPDEVTKFGGQ